MILKQYYLGCLAHASYLIADEASGVAAVVDPQRDIDEYIKDAEAHGCRVPHPFPRRLHRRSSRAPRPLVFPAHGAGSLCGKNLSTDTVSTLGIQRRYNYALAPMSRERFIDIVTTDQPDTPAYFTYDAVLNTRERPTLDEALERELRPLSLTHVLDLLQEGAQLLDTRESAEFEGAHVRGALNIGLGGSFATWCGTVLDREQPVVVIAEPGRELEAATRLGRIGFDTIAGHLAGGMQQLEDAPDLIDRTERITAGSAAEQLASAEPPLLFDVRSAREFAQGHIDAAVSLPLSQLRDRLDELPSDRPLVVHCAGGYRSAIAASVLRREGFSHVADLVGGLAAWESARLAIIG